MKKNMAIFLFSFRRGNKSRINKEVGGIVSLIYWGRGNWGEVKKDGGLKVSKNWRKVSTKIIRGGYSYAGSFKYTKDEIVMEIKYSNNFII
jgi:hypothetical protein